jgi:hypothetical protein
MSCSLSKILNNGLVFCNQHNKTVSKGVCSICIVRSPLELDTVDEIIQNKRVHRATLEITRKEHEKDWLQAKEWAESFPIDSNEYYMLQMVLKKEDGCNCKKLASRNALITAWKDSTINKNKV